MNLYNVEVTYTFNMVVCAEDDEDAAYVAKDNSIEAISDANIHPIVDVRNHITDASQLPTDWDSECVAYGDDGNTRISELLGE